MDLNTAYAAMAQAGNKIAELFSLKFILGAVLAVLLQRHFVLFIGFMVLVFIDCFTRWMAISHDYLEEKGMEEPSIVDDIEGIRAARAAGKIDSSTMKERGLGKIIIYCLCAFVAAVGDIMMHYSGNPAWMVSLMIGYMVVTEALSIVENLSDAGVKSMDKLIAKLKGKL